LLSNFQVDSSFEVPECVTDEVVSGDIARATNDVSTSRSDIARPKPKKKLKIHRYQDESELGLKFESSGPNITKNGAGHVELKKKLVNIYCLITIS
jgi:hypothetical protein